MTGLKRLFKHLGKPIAIPINTLTEVEDVPRIIK